jgi:hypothetical protein
VQVELGLKPDEDDFRPPLFPLFGSGSESSKQEASVANPAFLAKTGRKEPTNQKKAKQKIAKQSCKKNRKR